MKRRYRIDDDAKEDLHQIYEFIARDNPRAAKRTIQRFRECFVTLGRNLQMGQARPELATNLRSFSIGNYVLYFTPVEGGIEIVRVLHGARDINSIFP